MKASRRRCRCAPSWSDATPTGPALMNRMRWQSSPRCRPALLFPSSYTLYLSFSCLSCLYCLTRPSFFAQLVSIHVTQETPQCRRRRRRRRIPKIKPKRNRENKVKYTRSCRPFYTGKWRHTFWGWTEKRKKKTVCIASKYGKGERAIWEGATL